MTQISTDKQFKIEAQTYNQTCYRLSKNFVFFERNHFWESDSVQVDVFGSFWSVALTNTVEGQLGIQVNQSVFDLKGRHFIFIPPYSIVEWRIAKGLFKWCGYLSNNILPEDMPKEPLAFPWKETYFAKESELFEFVRQSSSGVQIGKSETASKVAAEIKRWIDVNFKHKLSLKNLADEMQVSQAYLSKEFKLRYGISPQSYINKVRAFEGMAHLLLDQTSIGETSAEIGYADAKSFYHHFIEEFRAKPSNYQQ